MPDKSTASLVQFHFLQESSLPKERRRLKAFIKSIFKKEKTALKSVSYIFCSDDYLLGINQQFLKHNYYTDIISFTLSDFSEPVTGEIYISAERVKENAIKYGVDMMTELYRVVFHGALHLCGYKDKTSEEKKEMRSAEDKYLDLFL